MAAPTAGRLTFALMASVVPLILVGLFFTGVLAAAGFAVTWSTVGAPTSADAAAKLVWSLYFLIHAVFVLLMSESRDVSPLLSLAALCVGALMFVCAAAALVSCLLLERRARAAR
jgi:hypothetical protein